MLLPRPRGPLSEAVFAAMSSPDPASVPVRALAADDPRALLDDEDVQVTLWALYELHYRGFEDVDPDHEWATGLLTTRAALERPFEDAIREIAGPLVARHLGAGHDAVAEELFALVEDEEHIDADGPSLAAYLQRDADVGQYREFLVHRSVYHRKESDPHAFAIPRLDGAAKVALAELQYDEFGGGRPDRLHSTLFAQALEGAGLDPAYGAHVDVVPAATLAVNNAMSLFALHRRLRGALMGHLAAFEATSSLPCRRYAGGAERLGLDGRIAAYFDEHVEADAVHEQLAARDICQRLVDDDPALHEDVLVGAAACVLLEAHAGGRMMEAWHDGRSSLLSATEAGAREDVA